MENSKLISILVTGSNKGIGYGIVKSLLEYQNKTKNWTYKIILTSRDINRGQEVISEFKNTFGEINEYLVYNQLDVTNEASINETINFIKKEFGNIDILVNNAGIAFKGQAFDTNVFDTTFSTNFYGTVNLTEKFLENNLIQERGKIIFIGSMLGNMKKLGKNLLKEFQNKDLGNEKLFDLANRFRTSIENETTNEDGWGKNCYAVSKMCINKYASLLAYRKSVYEKNIQVYSCCPGWVRTDMGGPRAFKSLEEGVICPIYLIQLENKINKEFQGKFFEDCKVSDIGI